MTSFAKALKKTAKKENGAKKVSKLPELVVPKHIQKGVDEYVKHKKAEKLAKSEKESAGIPILEHVLEHQDAEGFKGRYEKSYKVSGVKEKVTFVSSNRYSINDEDIDEIRELVGKNFDRLFEEKTEVKLLEEVFDDEALQKKLMKLIGDEFGNFFETTTKHVPRENFDRDIYRVVGARGHLEDLRVFCKKAKPALK